MSGKTQGGTRRKHAGIRGRRPDKAEARRDGAILRAKARGESDAFIEKNYLPRKAAS